MSKAAAISFGAGVGGGTFFAVPAALFGWTTFAVIALALAVLSLFGYVNALAVTR